MSENPDLSWLDRVSETMERRFGPTTRSVLAALQTLRKKEGGPG